MRGLHCFIKWLLLRGILLKWWILRKSRLAEEKYLENVSTVKGCAGTVENQRRLSGSLLRRILFIADCMWEREQLIPELEKIADITVLDVANALRLRVADQTENDVTSYELRKFIAACGRDFDLILLYMRPAMLSEEIFSLLRKKWSCPVFGMNLDEKSHFFPLGVYSGPVDNYRQWASAFDLNLSSTRLAADWYLDAGAPYHYLGMGFHPTGPVKSASGKKPVMSFVGSQRIERQKLLDNLAYYKIHVQRYGAGWQGSTGWLESADEIYRTSQINLGIGYASSNSRLTSLKARDYECPGAGGCYLTTYNWELAIEFEIGKEILCYRNTEELAEMYFWWIKRLEQCQKIALAGQNRCLAEYTWESRFRKAFLCNGFNL